MHYLIESAFFFCFGIYYIALPEKPNEETLTLSNTASKKPPRIGKKKLGLMLLVFSSVTLFYGMSEIKRSKRAEKEEFIEQVLSSIKQTLPSQMDEMTTLARVESKEETIYLYYEITGVDYNDFDEDKFKKVVFEKMVDKIRSSRNVIDYLKYKISFCNVYHINGSPDSIGVCVRHSELSELIEK